jgi:uncharacterized membrane protein YcaP (DUF421 family)
MDVDLAKIFLPDTPLLEIVLRGTVTYLALFVMLRVIGKRQAGGVGVTDLLVIVLIADAAQNSMAGQYTSVGDGLILVFTIMAWAWALDFLGYRFPAIQRLIYPPPMLLIEDGRTLPQNLRAQLLTNDELMSQLRAQGVADIAEVRQAVLEGSGQLTVVKRDSGADGGGGGGGVAGAGPAG